MKVSDLIDLFVDHQQYIYITGLAVTCLTLMVKHIAVRFSDDIYDFVKYKLFGCARPSVYDPYAIVTTNKLPIPPHENPKPVYSHTDAKRLEEFRNGHNSVITGEYRDTFDPYEIDR